MENAKDHMELKRKFVERLRRPKLLFSNWDSMRISGLGKI